MSHVKEANVQEMKKNIVGKNIFNTHLSNKTKTCINGQVGGMIAGSQGGIDGIIIGGIGGTIAGGCFN
ncbi:bacteriocin-type signal sequence [Enterococcus faecium]|nr:bacteriocin-type signal sequence [Enterococcus faecium]